MTSKKKEKISESLAIVCLLLNILVLPGVGSIIAKRTTEGIIQIVLWVVGWIGLVFLIGFPLLIAAWVWALVTGIQIVKSAN